jgi:cytochrome subunit of sulfide dehydrogenase
MKKILLIIILALTKASVVYAAEAFVHDVQTFHETHIPSLASTCAACHGTNGNSVNTTPILAGLDKGYFTTQMLAFKKGERSSTVMHHHAKGLTNDEINALAEYFSTQKRITPAPLIPQPLEDNHD